MLHNQRDGQNGELPPNEGGMGQLLGRRGRDDENSDNDNDGNLALRPRKKAVKTDPLFSNGRHFGRTIHAFCNIFPLIKDGLARFIRLQAGVIQVRDLSAQVYREHLVFQQLVNLSPGLDKRILSASAQELHYIAGMIDGGVRRARADDTKSIKSACLDWMTSRGGHLIPTIDKNRKSGRGFYHYRTGELLCPATLDWTDEVIQQRLRTGELVPTADTWPAFVYLGGKRNPRNPWDGLFRGELIYDGYKHIFIAPSSVGEESSRATRSGNAQIHGMTSVTIASLAYVATIVRFSLHSTENFSRNDQQSGSEEFYRSMVKFLEDPEEKDEVEELLGKIFPVHHATPEGQVAAIITVKDLIREWRREKRLALANIDPQQESSGSGV
ncbi:hypothetical protein EST38_g7807 [Candolleomyces aberdarensis]|uniref:Uncharacterized protein n=1 Tax=Candolleomyces aberdarensis TaxID=2316362 RepID=A0A4Q2DER7_9AGAR|nr:hypothetical protein EST38_g7807 [Candolleomyces aberdarensis]